MKIFLNGQPIEVQDQATLADVIAAQGLTDTACATAVNGEFVPRTSRATRRLLPNEQVMTFEPITGG